MQNKEWIVFVFPYAYPCNTGGLEVFNHYLSQSLKHEFDIHILTYCNKIEMNDLTVHHLKRCHFQKLTQPLSILYFLMKNRRSIRLTYFSYARSYWTNWSIYLVAYKLFKINYFFTIHGGGLTDWKPKWIHKRLFNNAKYITGVSDRIVDEYGKRSHRMIDLTPPLVPFKIHEKSTVNRADWGIAENEKMLLYVGSLKPLKSVDTLILAISEFPKEQLREFKLKVVIVGDGVSRQFLEDEVKLLGLNDFVIFLGLVEKEKVSELYALADFYTICSEYEGLPISLLEAFANGIPSVTSNAPGLVEVSENQANTIVFNTKDHKGYAQKLGELFYNKKLQNELKDNALFYYNTNFSHQKLVEKFKKYIELNDKD